MRSEAEMLELILQTAQDEPRVRAAVMNGSRVNPQTQPDLFQDFDIVYTVTELQSFKNDPAWIDRFGERMVLQCPADFGDAPAENHYTYLMQFVDGNRLDLTLIKATALELIYPDSLSQVLLDKDGLLDLPPPSEASYFPKPPTAKRYFEVCNEFWWVAPYVAKGLWCGEVIYAQHHLEVLRAQLLQMLEWHFGIATGFAQNPGKLGKRLPQHLSPERWQRLLQTYAEAEIDKLWVCLSTLTDLFRDIALEVATAFGFSYPQQDDMRVMAHLHHVRQLPKEASSMY